MIQSLSSRIFLQYRFNCESSFLNKAVFGFSTHPTHDLLCHESVCQASLFPNTRFGFNQILGNAPRTISGGSVPAERNVTLSIIFFKKIRRRYTRTQTTSHRSHRESRGRQARHCTNCPAQATRKTAKSALQVRYLYFKRGKPLCQAAACHSPLVPFGETPETIYQSAFDQP